MSGSLFLRGTVNGHGGTVPAYSNGAPEINGEESALLWIGGRAAAEGDPEITGAPSAAACGGAAGNDHPVNAFDSIRPR
ncbi:hypothetical protein GCM10023405_07390 [Streptomonospora salina]